MSTPAEILEKYAKVGEGKVRMPFGKTLALAVLAGAFIALAAVGAAVGAVSVTAPSLAKLVSACIFPAGLGMVVVAGSELFTGNNLLVIPLLQKRITLAAMLRNWGIVYLGNLLGAVTVAALATAGGIYRQFDGALAASVVATGQAKLALGFGQAFVRGVLCNFLVCIAVWMSFAADGVPGKLAAVFFPIALFVLCGYEHSVANMYYLPAALFAAGANGAPGLSWGGFLVRSLLPVTLGNLVGGAGGVGLTYWFCFGRAAKTPQKP